MGEEFNHVQNGEESSPDSQESLSTQHNQDSDSNSRKNDGGEKGGPAGGPPQPVPVFHSSLNKLRLQVFGLWLRTGKTSPHDFMQHGDS